MGHGFQLWLKHRLLSLGTRYWPVLRELPASRQFKVDISFLPTLLLRPLEQLWEKSQLQGLCKVTPLALVQTQYN